jgi:hypothetical protein
MQVPPCSHHLGNTRALLWLFPSLGYGERPHSTLINSELDYLFPHLAFQSIIRAGARLFVFRKCRARRALMCCPPKVMMGVRSSPHFPRIISPPQKRGQRNADPSCAMLSPSARWWTFSAREETGHGGRSCLTHPFLQSGLGERPYFSTAKRGGQQHVSNR